MIIKQAMTNKTKKDAFSIRKEVFIHEQHVPPEVELDQYDDSAIHFVGYKDKQPISASRLRIINNEGKLERVAVLKPYRHMGYGRQMIAYMEKHLLQMNIHQSTLNAQTMAINFYKQIGYTITSEPFLEANIEHVTMKKQLKHNKL